MKCYALDHHCISYFIAFWLDPRNSTQLKDPRRELGISLFSYLSFLCKFLQLISLVCPTRLIFLAMGEVLSFGFNLAVLDPTDRRGTDTYCIVAFEDKKMGFSSYCLS